MSKRKKKRKTPRQKRKLTAAERRARRERKAKYMTIFIHGKQKRVLRPVLIEGLPVDEFIARNADPIWLHQEEMWELIPPFGSPDPSIDSLYGDAEAPGGSGTA